MALSTESQEYHLTPKGWVTGTFIGDVFGGKEFVPTPNDRVLTMICYDKIAYVHAKPIYSHQIIWESEDKDLIKKLKLIWGDKPDWIGFEK
jgi:hypothetical protein